MKKILFVPDTHVPYEDKSAWALLLKAGREFKPDIVVILGDFADFYAVSDHDKNPNRTRLLDVEIAEVNMRLTDLDRLNASQRFYVKGNHEDRLERYLMRRAPELFNMVRIRELFKLDERGWRCVEYKDHLTLGKLNITHDTGSAGKDAHMKSLNDFQDNVIIGHTHRIGYTIVGNAKGKPHVGAMLGWLGDFKQVDYMHRIKAARDWAHGFGIGHMEPSGVVHVQPVPIIKNSVVLNGKLIRL